MNIKLAALIVLSCMVLTYFVVDYFIKMPPSEVSSAQDCTVESPKNEDTSEEPSLADSIQALGEMWELQRKMTQEYHNENYRKQYAIIVELMDRLGEDKIIVSSKLPEDIVIRIEEIEPEQVEIAIERH